jgi:hypothetical protein
MARSSDLAILVHLISDEQLNLNKKMTTLQTIPPLRKSSRRFVMYSNSEIKFYWFAAIFGCGLMLITLGTASAQQPLRPELILDVGAPQESSGAFGQSAVGALHQSGEWTTHAHDAQHTGVSPVASQKLAKIHWQVPVDLAPPEGEILIHYGSPLVTAKNTVIVPVKTGATSFRVQAHDGTTGNKLWTLNTAYQPPFAGFIPGLGPTLSHHHLFVPDTAGGILVRANPDKAKGNITPLYFYGLENYLAHPEVYQQAVKINTPLTADAEGNLYFGFTVIGITPIGLRGGLARISPDGTGTWVTAQSISGDDPFVSKISTSCAPALSPDGSIVYVATGTFDFGFGYLVALDSRTLQVINRVRLTDPASGLDATMTDETSASPTVGPDGDVY